MSTAPVITLKRTHKSTLPHLSKSYSPYSPLHSDSNTGRYTPPYPAYSHSSASAPPNYPNYTLPPASPPAPSSCPTAATTQTPIHRSGSRRQCLRPRRRLSSSCWCSGWRRRRLRGRVMGRWSRLRSQLCWLRRLRCCRRCCRLGRARSSMR